MSDAIIIVAKTGRAIDTSESFTVVLPFLFCFSQTTDEQSQHGCCL
jgi:hypothetical protein